MPDLADKTFDAIWRQTWATLRAHATPEQLHDYCRHFLDLRLDLKEDHPTLELEKGTSAHIISLDLVDTDVLPMATIQIGTFQVHGYLTMNLTEEVHIQPPLRRKDPRPPQGPRVRRSRTGESAKSSTLRNSAASSQRRWLVSFTSVGTL